MRKKEGTGETAGPEWGWEDEERAEEGERRASGGNPAQLPLVNIPAFAPRSGSNPPLSPHRYPPWAWWGEGKALQVGDGEGERAKGGDVKARVVSPSAGAQLGLAALQQCPRPGALDKRGEGTESLVSKGLAA